VILLDVALCVPGTVAGDSPPNLLFEDDFERDEVGAFPEGNVDPSIREKLDWCIRRGEWKIQAETDGNRYLRGQGSPGLIAIDKSVIENFRLEYTTWSEHPGDRSVVLSRQLPNFKYQDVYGFHLGGGYSRYNVIYHGGRKVAGPVDRLLPVLRTRQLVAVEKRGERLVMTVDGKVLFDVRDDQYANKVAAELAAAHALVVGFYTWSEGVCFDDVKLYQFPAETIYQVPAEAKAQGLYAVSFETDMPDANPKHATVDIQAGGKACVVNETNVVFHPDPEGQELVEDLCLLLDVSQGQEATAAATFAFKPLDDGFVELDVLARGVDRDCLTVALVDGRGRSLATLKVDRKGCFVAHTADGPQPLLRAVSYKNRPANGPLLLQCERWFTLRFAVDRRAGLFDVSLIDFYIGHVTPGMPYVRLGTNLPMQIKSRVTGLRVEARNAAKILVDNVIVAAPRARVLDGKPATASLRDILGLAFHPRRDPVTLYVHPLRHTFPARSEPDESRLNRQWARWETPPVFRDATNRYDALLVRYALLEEQTLKLRRMLYHLKHDDQSQVVCDQVMPVVSLVEAAATQLDGLLRIYARGFRNGWDEHFLEPDFARAAEAFADHLDRLTAQITTAIRACHNAAGENVTAGPPMAPGPHQAPAVWRNGRFERDGHPTCFWPPVGVRGVDLTSRNRQQDLLGLDNCFQVPRVFHSPSKPVDAADTIHRWDVFE